MTEALRPAFPAHLGPWDALRSGAAPNPRQVAIGLLNWTSVSIPSDVLAGVDPVPPDGVRLLRDGMWIRDPIVRWSRADLAPALGGSPASMIFPRIIVPPGIRVPWHLRDVGDDAWQMCTGATFTTSRSGSGVPPPPSPAAAERAIQERPLPVFEPEQSHDSRSGESTISDSENVPEATAGQIAQAAARVMALRESLRRAREREAATFAAYIALLSSASRPEVPAGDSPDVEWLSDLESHASVRMEHSPVGSFGSSPVPSDVPDEEWMDDEMSSEDGAGEDQAATEDGVSQAMGSGDVGGRLPDNVQVPAAQGKGWRGRGRRGRGGKGNGRKGKGGKARYWRGEKGSCGRGPGPSVAQIRQESSAAAFEMRRQGPGPQGGSGSSSSSSTMAHSSSEGAALGAGADVFVGDDAEERTGVLDDFVPSHDWQVVPHGQAAPGGLEYFMDFGTGLNWARLPPGGKP